MSDKNNSSDAEDRADSGAPKTLKSKTYLKELATLHVELVKLQEWVRHHGLKVCIVFEGRDGAGKGGTIKVITERVSSRAFRVVGPCRRPPSARRARCISSATCGISRRPERWSSSIAVGKTVPVSSG